MRALPFLFASFLSVLVARPAFAERAFPDVPDEHWAANAVRFSAVEHRFMLPYASGDFHGDDPFTRAQLAVALRHLLDSLEQQTHLSWETEGGGGYVFEDLASSPQTRAAALDVANRYRLFEGIPGVFPAALGGNRRVTRYEVAMALDHLLRLGEARGVIDPGLLPPREIVFGDVPADAPAAKAVQELARRYQVMVGFPDGRFRGPEELTRYQFAAAATGAFPLVRNLVELTREHHDRRRFQEDMPFELALGSRLDGATGSYGAARFLGYWGPAFLLARGRLGVPVGANDRESDAELGLGLAWAPGASLAFEPYVAGHYGLTGGKSVRAATLGMVTSWNPDPLQLWLDSSALKPLGALLADPEGPLMYSAIAGIGYAVTPRVAVTFELGWSQMPVAPAAAGYAFGADNALLGQAGLAFGF